MKLVNANVRRYRSIEDGSAFDVEADVTSLVGKNESGKSAVLQALYKSNPVQRSVKFDGGLDYPSRLTRERRGQDKIPVSVLAYELEDDDVSAVEAVHGEGVMTSRRVTITYGYGFGPQEWVIKYDEAIAVRHLLRAVELPASEQVAIESATTVSEAREALEAAGAPTEASIAAKETIGRWRGGQLHLSIIDMLFKRRPKFVYFGDYDSMPGTVSIPDLIDKRDEEILSRGAQAVVSLLNLAGVELEDFLTPESQEHLIRDSENASNGISDEVFQYWSQNTNLAVKLTLLPGPDLKPGTTKATGPLLQIRVENQRHRVTVPFDERSRGFVWFFSFLAYFSQIEAQSSEPLILLLDEPGINLHASAQADLLRFIDERLAPKHQVIFSTHSPFMISPTKLERVRTVMDVDGGGTQVSDQILMSDEETAFPLHAALGIDLAQTLFVAPQTLLVEGPSDVVYLEVLSEALKVKGREGLDGRFAVAPVGGAGKLPAFVTLLGANKLDVVVLADSTMAQDRSVERLRVGGRLAAAGLVLIGEATGGSEADVEDLFDAGFYIGLVNDAFAGALSGTKLKVSDLPQDPRLVRRVERLFAERGINGGRLNHYSPAAALLRGQTKLVPKLSDATLDRAEALFKAINDRIK